MEILLNILRFSAPVSLAAMGETVGQKSGLINIGLEGMMLTAAYVSVEVATRSGNAWLGLLSGVLAAVVMGLVQALFTIKWAIDQVVIGTAINLAAIGLTSTLFEANYGGAGKLLDAPSLLIAGKYDVILILLIPFFLAVTWALFRTNWGLALRATGEYPDAAEAAGFSAQGLRYQAQLIGAIFAGLAGVYLSLGIASSFAINMTAGRGFVAIAMVTFGRWKPLWVLGASLLVGFAESLQYLLQSTSSGLPPQLFKAIPYLLALAVLIVVGRGTVAPASLAVPYRRSK
ncbi:MAG: ABC transporter permease [Armatimonadetes bacterium]|nr:ABC transporter permease [Armatimonadota bacterium]